MERLQTLIGSLASSQRVFTLLSALEDARRLALADAFASCVEEIRGSAGAGPSTTAATADATAPAGARAGPSSASGPGAAAEGRIDVSSSMCSIKDINLLTPRQDSIKATLHILPDQMVFVGPKQDLSVPFKAIQRAVILDNIPKNNRVLLFLSLAEGQGAAWGKQRLPAVLLQMSMGDQADVPDPRGGEGRLAGQLLLVLVQVLDARGVDSDAFCSPDPDDFKSSLGYCAITTYHKVNQGHLFVLKEGFCFVERPALFLPREAVRKVVFQRANNTSSTFDFTLVLRGAGGAFEFTQTGREELSGFVHFLQDHNIKIGESVLDSDEEEGEAEGDGMEEDEDESDEDDSDFDPDHPDSEDERPSKRRRAGAEEGAEAEGAKEGDVAEEEGASSGSESDDESGSELELSDEEVDLEDGGKKKIRPDFVRSEMAKAKDEARLKKLRGKKAKQEEMAVAPVEVE